MSFESLRHTPEFELPGNAPSAPADLISLIEECYEGLAKVIVSKMLRRGKYDQIATIICQDNPSKKTMPLATADDISDYCMMCMQYDIDKTDEPGSYKVTLIGPPGKGRFERSKHVDLAEGDGMARSKTMMSEGELVEQQGQYIGELHAQSIAILELLSGMVKPLLQENKEQMKIISESARRLAEIERDRMKYDLEVRIHNDEIKMREDQEEMKSARWRETMEVIKESGMVEGLMKAVIKKINTSKETDKPDTENKTATKIVQIDNNKSDKIDKTKVEKAKNKKNKKKDGDISIKTQESIKNGDEMTTEQIQEIFESAAMKKVKDNPTAVLVEILKVSIDENEQWETIEKILSSEQFELFQKILNSEEDSEIESLLKELYELKGARRFSKLENELNEEQRVYVEKLLEIAMKD